MSFLRNRYSLQNPSNSELLMGEFKKSVKQKIVDAIKDLQVVRLVCQVRAELSSSKANF